MMKKIFLGIITLLVLPKIVFAGPVCDNDSYQISKAGSNVFTLNGGHRYTLNYYNVTSDGKTIKAYCMDPGRKGPSGTTYECERMIDPTGEISGIGTKQHALDVAISRAYYLLSQSHNGDNEFDRSVGEIVFRWLAFNFNLGVTEVSFNGGSAYVDYFKMQTGGGIKPYWNGIGGTNGQIVEEAKRIFYDAANVGNSVYREVGGNKTYQELVDSGLLPNEDFTPVINVTTDTNDSNHKIYTVHFNTPSSVAEVWWGDVTVGVTGNASAKIIENDGNGTVKIDVRATSSTYQYDVFVDISYYSPTSAATNLKLLKTKVNRDLQRMLVAVDSGSSTNTSINDRADASRKIIHGGRRYHITNPCVQINGQWYICDNSGIQDESHCTPAAPGVCENEPANNGKTCQVENGTFYGVSGAVVTPLVFYDECCESGILTPEEYALYCPCGYPEINYIGNCSEFNSDSEIVNTIKDTKDDADLKTCLFNRASVDAANNSVNMTDQAAIVTNRYCKVSCIEDYEFTLPNAKYTESGGYFTLTSQVSGKRTCYVNANVEGKYDGIDYELFLTDLKRVSDRLASAMNNYSKAKEALENISDEERGCGKNTIYFNQDFDYTTYEAYRSGNSISVRTGSNSVSENEWSDGRTSGTEHHSDRPSSCKNNGKDGSYNGIKNDILSDVLGGKSLDEYYRDIITPIQNEIQNLFNDYNTCVNGWENNFSFDPIIEFEYDEPYQNMTGYNKKFQKMSESSSANNSYCAAGGVGNDYKCTNPNNETFAQNYFKCDSNGNCSNTSSPLPSARFVTKTKTATATYKPQNNFSVYTPMGTIMLNKESGLYTILCKEKDCLPVSLNSPTGVFNFNFKFSNIGQYNDSNQNGRLMGGTNSVFDAVDLDAGYVCQYINNCPDCDYVCVGDHCEITEDPDCIDGNCNYVCQNCIFDGKEMGFYYRTVSIHNLFPTDREYGPNWNNAKGECTKQLIQNEGDNIYKEPEYSYTITPNQMRNIRQYNQTVSGYLNTQMPDGSDALQCHAQDGFSAIYCISAFLDTEGTKYFTENKRNDIWTLWPNNDYCTSSTTYSVRDGMGPAWK